MMSACSTVQRGHMVVSSQEKGKDIIAIRIVEFNQAMSGREGAQFAAPSPRAPNLAHIVPLATAMFCSTSTPKRGHFYRVNDGDISIES
jgi:arginase family enzyme